VSFVVISGPVDLLDGFHSPPQRVAVIDGPKEGAGKKSRPGELGVLGRSALAENPTYQLEVMLLAQERSLPSCASGDETLFRLTAPK
jgi:hypothetical protein